MIDAWPIVFCRSRKSAPARRANDAQVLQIMHAQRGQFSRPSREPIGEVIAGLPECRPARRFSKIGTTRWGIGTERRPAANFGLPSTSFSADLGYRTPAYDRSGALIYCVPPPHGIRLTRRCDGPCRAANNQCGIQDDVATLGPPLVETF